MITKDNCVYDDLKFDQACVNVESNNEYPNLWFYILSTDCVLCPYTRVARILSGSNNSLTVNTVRPLKFRVLNIENPDEYISAKNTSNVICDLSPNLGQFGVYDLLVANENCSIKTLKSPTNPYTEFYIILGILLFLLLAFAGARLLLGVVKRKCGQSKVDEVKGKEQAKPRIKAIDTFRGASTLLMIGVNGGSGGYPIFGHATWNGLLLGDLVFPCFIWIMGVCIPMALSSQIKRKIPTKTIVYSIVKRGILLFVIGIALNTVTQGPQLETMRIFGVLQRFGVTYLVVTLTYYFLIPRRPKKVQFPILREMQDCVTLFPQWCVMIGVVVLHAALTFGLHVPGCPNGYLGPGGRHDDGKHFDCAGGATGYIDKTILNTSHVFQKPTINAVYGSGPFEPEGILGCLTSIFQVFLGVQAGVIMMSYKDWKGRVIRWLLWAVIYGVIGCILHFTNAIPVNKSLWSLSFVFVSTAFALACLSACYLLVDVTRIWRGGPFRVPGMNALLLYAGHIVCYKVFPFHWRIGNMDSRALRLVETLWCVALWTLIAYKLHRKRTYITV